MNKIKLYGNKFYIRALLKSFIDPHVTQRHGTATSTLKYLRRQTIYKQHYFYAIPQ